MEIKGKVHCFFEQSGTFKREFIKLGIPAEDYDIQDNFGETDHVTDLFEAIEDGFAGNPSIFDEIEKDDMVLAFFPCIEFSCVAQFWYSLDQRDYRKWDTKRIFDYMLRKNSERSRLFELLYKFVCVCLLREIRMIMENPWAMNTYLKQNVFFKNPDIVDIDRSRRGDTRIKPTAYWFWNCQPTNGFTHQQTPKELIKYHSELKQADTAGICSEDRSMISSDYARNFICDFVLGRKQPEIDRQLTLFD